MSDHVRQTIEDLKGTLRQQQEAVNKTKALINQLCSVAGMPPMYTDVELEGAAGAPMGVLSDQFYGRPLATCTKEILELRRRLNQGPATINELYAALLEGGFKFDTKNDENAKRNLRISVTKNTALFHKLPNGKIGLTEWYPKVRKGKDEGGDE